MKGGRRQGVQGNQKKVFENLRLSFCARRLNSIVAEQQEPSGLPHPIFYNSPPTSRLNELLLPAPTRSVSHFLAAPQKNSKQWIDQCRPKDV